jgi:hypothetical protein
VEVIAQYATNHQQAMDAYEIVDDIYRHAEFFYAESGMIMQPDYVGKPKDLYLWCLIRQSKTFWEYVCPRRFFCRRDTDIRITETKQTLTLETIGMHDLHSHVAGKMHARKSAAQRLALVVFLAQREKNLLWLAELHLFFHL